MAKKRKTVEILYKNGVPVDKWESKEGEPRQYGRAETPSNGYVVVRVLCPLNELPPAFLEFGGDKGRLHLDEAKMSEDERQLFKDEVRYRFLNHAVKHTITKERLALLVADHSDEWEAYLEEARVEAAAARVKRL